MADAAQEDDEILERARDIVEWVEQAACVQNAEGVLDRLNAALALYPEFPETIWDVSVCLIPSRHPAVRIAMATHGIPHIHNEIGLGYANKHRRMVTW